MRRRKMAGTTETLQQPKHTQRSLRLSLLNAPLSHDFTTALLVGLFTQFVLPPPRTLCNTRRLPVCLYVCLFVSNFT